MLKTMFDFSIRRSFKSAVAFYLFYSFLDFLIGFLAIILLTFIVKYTVTSTDQYDKLIRNYVFFMNHIFYFAICVGFSLLFIYKKRLRCAFSIILFILSIFLTFVDGDILGLIPAAILSTFPNRNISE